jgi:hypothetical protein
MDVDEDGQEKDDEGPAAKRRRVAHETARSVEGEAPGGAVEPDPMDVVAVGDPEEDAERARGGADAPESPPEVAADEMAEQTTSAVEEQIASEARPPEHTAQPRRYAAEDQAMSSDDDDDDDDGSDFEIPTLIPRRNFNDDSDSEEDGGAPLL